MKKKGFPQPGVGDHFRVNVDLPDGYSTRMDFPQKNGTLIGVLWRIAIVMGRSPRHLLAPDGKGSLMNAMPRRWIVSVCAASLVFAAAIPASAEVLNVKGSAKSSVVQFAGVFPIQTDLNQELVPGTKALPPAIARAKLDRLLTDGTITASGQALAIFDQPADPTAGPPNDAGLDLGAFSDDEFTGWFVEGNVNEVRTLQLAPGEISPDAANGSIQKVRSRVLLSGVLLITSAKTGADLSGVRTNFAFSVTLRQNGRQDTTPIAGEVTLAGTATGDAQVQNAGGALASIFLPIVDFTDQLPELPVVRALPFAGVNLPYEYEIIVGQPFELELTVRGQVFTTPGGVGAAAVFGTPQEGLGSVLTRVKGDDRGVQLADMVSEKVDTTGKAYANTPVDAPSFTTYFPACGLLGFESTGLLTAAMLVTASRRRRNRRR